MAKSYEILEAELEKMAFKDGACIIMAINPDDVVVGNWVRLKCQYGCPSYGKEIIMSHHIAPHPRIPGKY